MDPRAPQPSPRALNRRDGLVLLGLWLACLTLDLLWIHQHQAPPSWDQGDHLSRALGIWQVLRSPEPWSGGWWQQLWAQAIASQQQQAVEQAIGGHGAAVARAM